MECKFIMYLYIYDGVPLLGGVKILLIFLIVIFSILFIYVFISTVYDAGYITYMGYDYSFTGMWVSLFFISIYILILSITLKGLNLGNRPYALGLARFCLVIFYIIVFFPISFAFWILWSRLNNPITKLWCGSNI